MLDLLLIFFAFIATVVAQSSQSTTVVCVAGQCLQGFSNTTIGTTMSASGAQTSVLLLPGQYTATTNPQLLHDMLTSSSASLSPSSGFENSSSSRSLPLNIQLSPGLAIYSQSLYGGSAGFSALPTTPLSNNSTPIQAGSMALSSNVWVALDIGQSQRVIVWDSVPDFAQLPVTGSLSLRDIQSSACSPPCSGNGVCSASGTCTCPTGFTGSSCESCAKGFFGPNCQPCPEGCTSCDEGINGSGRCLTPTISNAPSSCNCQNGQCGSGGQCTCNTGWTTSDNGTQCAKCSAGFFLTSTGDCQACQLGCTACVDGTGVCQTCKTNFTLDANDKTKCNPTQSVTNTGTVCPDGSFSDGTRCQRCSPSCSTCRGPTSNDCVLCAAGSYAFNGGCVAADGNGVCQGTNLIADNNKNLCDTCGAKCTTCRIPNFSVASTVNELQCTGCLPGSFLSQGKCVASCPQGTFVDPKDNVTCTACDSSCGSCSGSANFCLTCSSTSALATPQGTCENTCPQGTFQNPSTRQCTTCHPDCATCTGTGFNQCQSCPRDRPVLNNGRCLPTCSKGQFLDTNGACTACDSTCGSCSGSGPSQCLSCSSSTQHLKGGQCVDAGCTNSTAVIPGLGVCLSNLVQVPPTPTGTEPPLPTITGLDNPTVINQTSSGNRLEWWQILLMALGCAFIFLVIVMWWRRRMRRKRAAATKQFARAKNLDGMGGDGWRYKMVRWGERFFGHKPSQRVYPAAPPATTDNIKLREFRDVEEAAGAGGANRKSGHTSFDMDGLIGAYEYDRGDAKSKKSKSPSVHDHHVHHHHHLVPSNAYDNGHTRDLNRLSGNSLYSEITGMPRNTPETKQPVRKPFMLNPNASRFSASSYGSSMYSSNSSSHTNLLRKPTTEAQKYARDVRPGLGGADGSKIETYPSNPQPTEGFLVDTSADTPVMRGAYWMEPHYTGASSNNPFRR